MRPTSNAIALSMSVLLLAPAFSGCARERAPETGAISVRSEPVAGADIFLNGAARTEKTNAVLRSLKPGHYQIRATLPAAGAEPPLTGEADVEVKAGSDTRIVISLNRMAVVPAAAKSETGPSTRAQKSIFDFYAALTAAQYESAFSFLTPAEQRARGGIRKFTQSYKSLRSARIVNIEVQSRDSTAGTEINRVHLDLVEGTETTTSAGTSVRRSAVITTSEDDFGGSGLPRIVNYQLVETPI